MRRVITLVLVAVAVSATAAAQVDPDWAMVFRSDRLERQIARESAREIISDIRTKAPMSVGLANQIKAPVWTVRCILADFGFLSCPSNNPALANSELDILLHLLPYDLAKANPGIPVGFFEENLPSRWRTPNEWGSVLDFIECHWVEKRNDCGQ